MLIVIVVLAVATAILGGVAWTLTQEERRRSEARVAALLNSLDSQADPPATDATVLEDASALEVDRFDEDALASEVPMFIASRRERERPSWATPALVAASLVLVGGAALIWTSHALPTAAASTTQQVQPLELLSLTSLRRGSDLTVTGLVRNPQPSVALEHLAAVVLCFDERGRFLTSSRALLDVQALAPGDESPFHITLSAPEGVSRYRVSFRRAEGAVIPHVDRRAGASGVSTGSLAARTRPAGA